VREERGGRKKPFSPFYLALEKGGGGEKIGNVSPLPKGEVGCVLWGGGKGGRRE